MCDYLKNKYVFVKNSELIIPLICFHLIYKYPAGISLTPSRETGSAFAYLNVTIVMHIMFVVFAKFAIDYFDGSALFLACVVVIPQTTLRAVVCFAIGRVLFSLGYANGKGTRLFGLIFSNLFGMGVLVGSVVLFSLQHLGLLHCCHLSSFLKQLHPEFKLVRFKLNLYTFFDT